jgi:hypothetical protein
MTFCWGRIFSKFRWFWQVTPKRFEPSHLLFFPFAVLALLVIRRLVSFPGRPLTKLLLSVGLLFCLQLAFGAAAGRGFESLRTNFSGRGMSREVVYSAQAGRAP